MALARNTSRDRLPVTVSSGNVVAYGSTDDVNPNDPGDAALIASGQLLVVDGSTPPPLPAASVVDVRARVPFQPGKPFTLDVADADADDYIGADGTARPLPPSSESGGGIVVLDKTADYALATEDGGEVYVRMANTALATVTIPAGQPRGRSYSVSRRGSGPVNVTGANGVTFSSPAGTGPGPFGVGNTKGAINVVHVGSDKYDVVGDVIAATPTGFNPAAMPGLVNGWWTKDLATAPGSPIDSLPSAVGGSPATGIGGTRPTAKAAGSDGYKSVNFTASERRLVTTGEVLAGGSYTVYTVAKLAALPVTIDKYMLTCDAQDVPAKNFGLGFWTDSALSYIHGSEVTQPAVDTVDDAWHVYQVRKTAGGNAQVRIDDGTWTTVTSTAAALTGGNLVLGAGKWADGTSLSNGFVGELKAVFPCPVVHTDGQANAQVAALMAEFDIS